MGLQLTIIPGSLGPIFNQNPGVLALSGPCRRHRPSQIWWRRVWQGSRLRGFVTQELTDDRDTEISKISICREIDVNSNFHFCAR